MIDSNNCSIEPNTVIDLLFWFSTFINNVTHIMLQTCSTKQTRRWITLLYLLTSHSLFKYYSNCSLTTKNDKTAHNRFNSDCCSCYTKL